jgi:LmbE family N-acetylglucosaminyl deacetylase
VRHDGAAGPEPAHGVLTGPIDGVGTPEARWAGWTFLHDLPRATPATLLGDARRLVVVAPHPDDETLAATALLRAGLPVLLVAVTDGTGSHPGSERWPVRELARVRPRESLDALALLGVTPQVARLGLPDGGVAAGAVADGLRGLLRAGDAVVSTWRADGHPDHEAAGTAAAIVTGELGLPLVEAPVWTWHWAEPGDPRVPWARMVRVDLDPAALAAKRSAVAAYRSQVEPDPALQLGAVLPAGHLARLLRPFEIYLPGQ